MDKDKVKKIQLVYIGNDHFQRTERDTDDYWSIYIPHVIYKKLGINPQEHEPYILTLRKGMINSVNSRRGSND